MAKSLLTKKYYIFIIGCAQNYSDAERAARVLEDADYSFTNDEKEADLIIALACSVRQTAVDRIYGKAKIWKSLKKKPLLIISGCILPKDKTKLMSVFDLIFEIKDLQNLPELLKAISDKKLVKIPIPVIPAEAGILKIPGQARDDILIDIKPEDDKLEDSGPSFSRYKIGIRPDRQARMTNNEYFNYLSINPKHSSTFRALVPISNGCNNFCSYCAVPYVRGREVSRPFKEIIEEIKELVGKGYKEIILLGQNVNSYGKANSKQQIVNSKQTRTVILATQGDQNQNVPNTDSRFWTSQNNDTRKEEPFLQLLKEIDKIPGDFWARFISNHPKDMTENLIKTLGKLKKATPAIHLPLQSGSNKILKAMNRNYTKAKFLNLVKKIRKEIPECAITTDVIVGFPGETEMGFEETVAVFEKAGFDMAYISQYSPRQETIAAKLKDNVSKEEKKKREEVLNKILSKTALENNQKFVRKTVKVLIDGQKGGKFYGRSLQNKVVEIQTRKKGLIGTFQEIKIEKATPWKLIGTL
ncbi:MAG: MiaB/RimO family radical SAM methylthiotransferase [Patescibacteria group bacterium]|nr:MiaB/RimO family radical SAM methylthiotransferase [Patescibacteria group bacterium]